MTTAGDLAIGDSFVWHGMAYTVLRESKRTPAGYKIPVIKIGAGTEHFFNPTMEVERVDRESYARRLYWDGWTAREIKIVMAADAYTPELRAKALDAANAVQS